MLMIITQLTKHSCCNSKMHAMLCAHTSAQSIVHSACLSSGALNVQCMRSTSRKAYALHSMSLHACCRETPEAFSMTRAGHASDRIEMQQQDGILTLNDGMRSIHMISKQQSGYHAHPQPHNSPATAFQACQLSKLHTKSMNRSMGACTSSCSFTVCDAYPPTACASCAVATHDI
jgi:hypothetical protein